MKQGLGDLEMGRMGERKERPILFSGAMVRALLAGTKTQTRRVVKRLGCQCGEWLPQEMSAITDEGWQTTGHSGRWWCEICASDEDAVMCPYGKPWDRLWVKETFSTDAITMYPCPLAWYRATDFNDRSDLNDWHVCPKVSRGRYADCLACWEEREGRKFKWKPSIFMPRHLSRITLEIVRVRVERLQEISEGDAVAEGIHRFEVNECVYFHWRKSAPTEEHFTSGVMAYRDLWESINGPGSWELNPWVWVVEFKRVEVRA